MKTFYRVMAVACIGNLVICVLATYWSFKADATLQGSILIGVGLGQVLLSVACAAKSNALEGRTSPPQRNALDHA